MNKAFFAAAATLAVLLTGAAHAQVPRSMSDTHASGAVATSLQTLLADWNRIGFQPPSKPGQYRVYGRDGHITSGPEYSYMVSLIRTAGADARAGRNEDALTKIARVRRLLGKENPQDG
jgi:hypothetical protein